jgi:polyisoprenoid-binding protein YceI
MLHAAIAALVLAAAPTAPPPASIAPTAAAADTTKWRIDVAHSELTFRVRHLVSRVSGTFREWSGTITGDPADWSKDGAVEVTIQTASIDTRSERRDGHLRSPDFFDAASHPVITFRSRSVRSEGTQLVVEGDLTMRGVTKPVTLTGEVLAVAGGRAGFSAETRINRHDFGVSYNRAVEGGGVLLGDEVTIELSIQAIRQKA